MTTLLERLHLGLVAGVEKHWGFTKEMFDIKPEYLLTVSTADALLDGFDEIEIMDAEVRLELRTRRVAFRILSEVGGPRNWFKFKKGAEAKRKGRVDIFLAAAGRCYVIELKGFDPSRSEIEKEVLRFANLFEMGDGSNALLNAFVIFPSRASNLSLLESIASEILPEDLKSSVEVREKITDEDPLDGMPHYFTNSISIYRAAA